MDELIKSYRSALLNAGYREGLVDYLTQIATRALAEINAINTFTVFNFDVKLVSNQE